MMTQAIHNYLVENNYEAFSPKAFFFDMDGVLFDSMKYHAPAWVQAFADHGYEFSLHDAYRNEGRTGMNIAGVKVEEVLGCPATDEEKRMIYEAKSAHFRRNVAPGIIPYVDEVLRDLRIAGKDVYVVTGSAERTLFDSLDAHFPHTFVREKMVTAYDVKFGKPHPEPYLMGLAKSGFQPFEGVVIENAPLGAQSGRASGMFTIVVNTGILGDQELYDAGAHIVLPDMRTLLDLLPKMLLPVEH